VGCVIRRVLGDDLLISEEVDLSLFSILDNSNMQRNNMEEEKKGFLPSSVKDNLLSKIPETCKIYRFCH